jgi:hypothetical protein
LTRRGISSWSALFCGTERRIDHPWRLFLY